MAQFAEMVASEGLVLLTLPRTLSRMDESCYVEMSRITQKRVMSRMNESDQLYIGRHWSS